VSALSVVTRHPLGPDVGEATGGRSVSCRRPGCRRSFYGLDVFASSPMNSDTGEPIEEKSTVPSKTVKLLF